MKEKEKTYIDDSNFMEFIDQLATQITEMNFGADTYSWYESKENYKLDKDAQNYYNEIYDEYETMANNIMGVYKHHDMIMHIYPNKNK